MILCKKCFNILIREEEKMYGLCDECYDYLYSVKDSETGEK